MRSAHFGFIWIRSTLARVRFTCVVFTEARCYPGTIQFQTGLLSKVNPFGTVSCPFQMDLISCKRSLNLDIPYVTTCPCYFKPHSPSAVQIFGNWGTVRNETSDRTGSDLVGVFFLSTWCLPCVYRGNNLNRGKIVADKKIQSICFLFLTEKNTYMGRFTWSIFLLFCHCLSSEQCWLASLISLNLSKNWLQKFRSYGPNVRNVLTHTNVISSTTKIIDSTRYSLNAVIDGLVCSVLFLSSPGFPLLEKH